MHPISCTHTAFEIQVRNMLAIKCQDDFRIFQFVLTTSQQKTAEDSAEVFLYYVSIGFGITQHFVMAYDLAF